MQQVSLEHGLLVAAILFGIGLAVLGFFLPNIILYQTGHARSEQILRELLGLSDQEIAGLRRSRAVA